MMQPVRKLPPLEHRFNFAGALDEEPGKHTSHYQTDYTTSVQFHAFIKLANLGEVL